MAQNNDIQALFDQIIDRNDAMIRRVCVAYSTPSTPSDDLYQEAMIAVWRGLAGFRGESALTTWVYRTTINACISFLRHSVRHRNEISLDNAPDIVGDVDMAFDKADEQRRLRQLIAQLGEIDKAIILMWLDERSYIEIAEVTGLSRNVVGVRINRIKTRLRHLFEPTGHDR